MEGSSILKDILPLILTLAAVVFILYLSYVFTRYIGIRSFRVRGSGNMKIVDTISVTQDKSVVVLKADDKFYLLAVSPTDIKLIKELDKFDESNSLSSEVLKTKDGIDFKSMFEQSFLHKKK